MLCPKCKCEMRISTTETSVEGDESPLTQTKVYTVQTLCCRNPACENFGRATQTVRTQLYKSEAH